MQPIGASLRAAWQTYRTNWKVLSLIAGIPLILTNIGSLCSKIGPGGLALIGALLSIAGVILSLASQAALVTSVQKIKTGQGSMLDVWSEFRGGSRFILPVIFVVLIQILVSSGSFMFFIIPAIIFGVYTSLYVFTIVIDGKRGLDALIESYHIVRGRWWEVLGRIIVVTLTTILVLVIVQFIASGILFVLVIGTKTTVGIVVTTLVSIVLNAVAVPFIVAYMYDLYISLKTTRVPATPTAFKTWIIVFMVLGIFTIVSIPIFLFNLASTASMDSTGMYDGRYVVPNETNGVMIPEGKVPGMMPVMNGTNTPPRTGGIQNY